MDDGIGMAGAQAPAGADAGGAGGGRRVKTIRKAGQARPGPGVWRRIREEYAAGAGAPWLAARYGVSVRALHRHAEVEGWRRIDLAAENDRALEAAEAAGTFPTPERPEPWTRDVKAEAETAAEIDRLVEGGWAGAGEEALRRAVEAMTRGQATEAAAYARLAGAMQGVAAKEEAAARDPARRDPAKADAAMRFLAARLGVRV